MTEKYTFRDFLVYFLTGLFLLLTLLHEFNNSLLDYFKITKQDISENSAITIFLLVPGLYLLGHIIHGMDLIIFKLGRYVEDFNLRNKNWFLNKLNYLLNGNRINGILFENKNPAKTGFWELVINYNNPKIEYWLVINDLLKGLYLISFFWSCYFIIKCNCTNAFIYSSVTFIFWYRARYAATNFVTSINYLAKKNDSKYYNK